MAPPRRPSAGVGTGSGGSIQSQGVVKLRVVPATALTLMDHQVRGIDWLNDRSTGLLADEPGLGKTVQLLRSAIEPVLVVAPAMVLESGTWDDEIEKWAPGMDVTQVAYTNTYVGAGGRVRRAEFNVPIVQLKPQYRQRWGSVILDEAHYLKGRKTSWTHALKDWIRTDKMMLATGTPIPNWAHEAFMLLQFIYPDEAKPGKRYGSYWRWVNTYFEVSASRYNPQAKEIGTLKAWYGGHRPNEQDWARFREENWGDRILLRLREDCLDLPPLTEQDWKVRMTGEQEKAYKALKRDFITWLDDGTEVQAWSEAALMVKLLKCATGLEALDPARLVRNPKLKPTGKFAMLASIFEDRPRQTIVSAHFRDSVEAAHRLALKMGRRSAIVHGGISSAERTLAIRGFQRGEVDVLCASLHTIREGMTLHQAGCDQIVTLERSWTPSYNDQLKRRIHRIGQDKPVTVINIVADKTLDLRVLKLLHAKTDEQMKALSKTDIRSLIS